MARTNITLKIRGKQVSLHPQILSEIHHLAQKAFLYGDLCDDQYTKLLAQNYDHAISLKLMEDFESKED